MKAARVTAEAAADAALAGFGESDFTAGFDLLKGEIAYRAWHSRVFARFLSTSHLPEILRVSDFYTGDLSGQIQISRETGEALDHLLDRLPEEVFAASENLGWMYQVWQNVRKETLRRSERKIGGADLGPATQLFTESYLIRFLLENTLGAWWSVHHPASPLLKEMEFLRWRQDGEPAAGGYPGWPGEAAEITIIDPCCGTGHFLVSAFHLLRQMRMEEAGLGEAEAAAAVLQENLFGLDLDPHCTQITILTFHLEAWRLGVDTSRLRMNILPASLPIFPDRNDPNPEPEDPVAGQVRCMLEQFPEAGSLLGPSHPAIQPGEGNLASCGRPDSSDDLLRLAHQLSRRYVLVATNVPYLARRKQSQRLQKFLQAYYPLEKADLATAFLRRSLRFLQSGGTAALVTPQNWLFLGAYQAMREELLAAYRLDFLVKIGEWGFRSLHAAGAFTALVGISSVRPGGGECFFGLDASVGRTQSEKIRQLQEGQIQFLSQSAQLLHPDSRIVLGEILPGNCLGDFATSLVGIQTGDNPYYTLRFWELERVEEPWEFCLTPAGDGDPNGGRECVLRWEAGQGRLQKDPGARVQGLEALGQNGVAVLRVRTIRAFPYAGELYDQNVAVIHPHNPAHLPAILAFCTSDEFPRAVRLIDQKLNVTNATLTKVPFDLDHWQREAKKHRFPHIANHTDARQWLFEGDPAGSNTPLQVAVARLLGYRWPTQPPDRLDEFAVPSGILPLPAVGGSSPAVERLRALLRAAYGAGWSSQREAELLAAAGHPENRLEHWLRDHFFAGHCRLFRNRPFIWQIWDGRRDGFGALVNYHKFSQANLNRLIDFYLAEWIERQKWEERACWPGAVERLAAAEALSFKLSAILYGEPPYDLYIRWKLLALQPIGWDPDLNDGVRLNLRPFVTAGVLRTRFNIHWNKDRGLNQDGSERLNDLHISREAKEAVRFTK